jgi:microcystin-dependent protein
MSDQFLGEIRPFPFNFAPYQWALCQGQLLPISQNAALFSLLGTYYGGDGRTNFALPNLQGQIAVCQGQGPGLSLYDIGETIGTETVTLNISQIPAHGHNVPASTIAGRIETPSPTVVLGPTGRGSPPVYSALSASVFMSATAGGNSGGSLSHNNMMPYVTISFCISLSGIFPARG